MERSQLVDACLRLGYKYFDRGSYNMNVIAVRNSDPGNRVTNSFDDWITLSYKDDQGVWKFHSWPCTTDPGRDPMLRGNNGRGVARVVPGQYPGSHMIGLHQGKYEALRQCGLLMVYRDSDMDLEYDTNVVVESKGDGINIHYAGEDSILVGEWSHGCTVFKRKRDFKNFMRLLKMSTGKVFTYTLIESKDLLYLHP